MAAVPAAAHEVRPAVADVTVGEQTVDLSVRLVLEQMLVEMDLTGLEDTDESVLAAQYDALRAEDGDKLKAELIAVWPGLAPRFIIKAGETAVLARIVSVEVPPVGNTDLPRDTVLTLQADLPDDGSAVATGQAQVFVAAAR